MDAAPDSLDEWRNRLFHVTEVMTLSEEEWSTYWPYVDNIWSHRSTQKSKKGPFQTHYYDCRLKGRPPGTPQNQDPNKKKRKRTARERDLCDMKIKVIETFGGPAGRTFTIERVRKEGLAGRVRVGDPGGDDVLDGMGMGGMGGMVLDGSGGAGDDGVAGSEVMGAGLDQYGLPGMLGEVHRHSLEESDRIKKCTVEREGIKRQKEMKKVQKTYPKKASGQALQTVKRHSKPNELKLFGSCFCPFVQRVWIALEVKGLNYQYIEVDPYKKPQSLLDINPRGLVPALKHGDWGCYESTVLLDYLEDLGVGTALLPEHPQVKATSRLWVDHVNRNIVPGFYRYLQAQEQQKQVELAEELRIEIAKIVDAADVVGPFFLGPFITFVDVSIAPWLLRLSRVLHPYKGWPLAQPGTRLAAWINALEGSEAVGNTLSDPVLYLENYERYAENRPDTSLVARAVNAGRGLP
ncbi:uncharacterized protein LAJ45_07322 [Morchella importuna]|uniref:uncharacterized protein n=1 Tax=Morchella importuna TaxID=1174673 RepID=UPI001E8DB3BC|nr:uncharacterized protein LAJ45_07322 [Morchella importuna]KAH8148611.1 hypothetical protein LAJ45_07322 [Morchella importuna]